MSLKRCFSTGIHETEMDTDRVQSMKRLRKSSVGLRKVIPSQQEKLSRDSRKKNGNPSPCFESGISKISIHTNKRKKEVEGNIVTIWEFFSEE